MLLFSIKFMLYFPKERVRLTLPFTRHKMLMRMWLEYLMLKSSDKKSIDLFWKGAKHDDEDKKKKQGIFGESKAWLNVVKTRSNIFHHASDGFIAHTYIRFASSNFLENQQFFFRVGSSYRERMKIFYCWWDYIEQWRIFHTILFDAMILISQNILIILTRF